MFDFLLPTTGAQTFEVQVNSEHQNEDAFLGFSTLLESINQNRGQLRDILKRSKRSTSKDVFGVVKICESYIPDLFRLYRARQSDSITFKHGDPILSWRATLLDDSIPGKSAPRLDFVGIEWDCVWVSLTYGYALCNYSSLVPPQQAIELLCKSAGVLTFLQSFLTSLPSREGKVKSSRCPEMYPQLPALLAKAALGQAQILSLTLLAVRPNTSANLLCRIAQGSADYFSSAAGILSSHPMQKAIVHDLERFITAGRKNGMKLAAGYLGMDAAKTGNVGFAVACGLYAQSLTSSSSSFKPSIKVSKDRKDLITDPSDFPLDLTALLRGWKKENDQVMFQPIPAQSEVQKKIPSGRELVQPKEFTLHQTDSSNRNPGTEIDPEYAGKGGYY